MILSFSVKLTEGLALTSDEHRRAVAGVRVHPWDARPAVQAGRFGAGDVAVACNGMHNSVLICAELCSITCI